MATSPSRYDAPTSTQSGNNPSNVRTEGNTGGTTNTTGSTTGTRTTDSNSVVQNMDPTQLAILNTLLTQLAGGGTPNQKEDRATRRQEIGQLQMDRKGYSKEAAFADAKGLMAQTIRQTLEKLMPSINSSSLGAGASQSSMRALLVQRAGENAAENASAQGLTAAVNYGGVSNGMSQVLERLIGQQDPATTALINALSVAKGSTVTSSGSSTETSAGTSSGTNTQSGNASEQKTIEYTKPQFLDTNFRQPEQEPATGIGSTADFLNQLYGDQAFLSKYKF